MKFTTYVAIDREHWPELELALLSWRKFCPAIIENPLVAIVDERFSLPPLSHPNVQEVRPAIKGGFCESQRERMLTALALEPANCQTEWFLKLDTDAVASRRINWPLDQWGTTDFAFVASPWGYTKPGGWMRDLDEWSVGKNFTRCKPSRSYSQRGGVEIAKCRRVISYAMLCRTAFAVEVASLCGDRLPVPSQDTVYWYLAERLGRNYLAINMQKFGWAHCGSSVARVRAAVNAALTGGG